MADTAFTLTDENGLAWDFPAGFDPQQAARIVKQHNEEGKQGSLGKFINWATTPTGAGVAVQTGANQTANAIEGVDRLPVRQGVWDTVKDLRGIATDIASGLVHNPVATMRGGVAGIEQGIGDQAAAMSSPAALTALAAGPLAGQVGKVAPAAAKLIRLAGSGANGVLAAQGGAAAVNAPDIEGKVMGAAQAALGAHGTFSDPAILAGMRKAAVPAGEALVRGANSAAVRNTLRAGAVGAAGGAAAYGHPFAAGGVLPIAIAPEAMRYIGGKLIEAGHGTSGVGPLAAATGAEPQARPAGAAREAYSGGIGETAQEASKRMADQARIDLKKALIDSADQPIASTSSFLADLKKLGKADAKDVMAARDAAKGQRNAPAAPAEVAPVGAPAEPDVPVTGRMEDALAQRTPITEQDIRQGRTGDNWNKGRLTADKSAALPTELADQIGDIPDNPEWFKQNGPLSFDAHLAKMEAESGLGKVQDFSAEGAGPTDAGMGGPKPGPAIGELPPKQLTGEVDNGLPADATVNAAGPTDNNPPPGPAIEGDLGTPETTFEEMLAKALEKGSGKPAEAAPEAPPINLTEPTVVPDNDPRVAAAVPPEAMPTPLPSRPVAQPTINENGRISANDKQFHSKSRRSKSQMSATPGYSKRDLSDVGLNPDLKYKDFDPTIHAKILANRASRASKYYGDALEAKAQAEAGL